ncbi:3-oxoacyl-[acyl-carrier-protein] synthase-3 [Paenibacillus sophorae]|uniref:Beta-ketoacyl-[acyl-carrier-protein] synthase III n=1 Tax=Paenibacillus sophorae TaxID=1333845 RepID=A0A1H8FR54_9BACL|nr:ketoacyl-ACP synthase III [Paenibacillus sophorae]QWU13954.1 ketoacyl-ACP synthase III [Paenibacillus sophorae]SEN34281.1 3-oxoacyl-[acyl-carrier-protein] synthase-3 [Paenibacillus sophorae]
MVGARITAIGTYVPEKRLTNFNLERMVDTNNEWIIQRTGIEERRISRPDEFTSDLCVAAVKNLIQRFNKTVEDVDMVIVATSTPDFPFPSVSSLVQDRLHIAQTGAMDISAACSGFVYALHTAHGMISSGLHSKILVIGADTMSKITDYTDRTTCILFGDGAGAVLIERDDQFNSFIGYHMGSDGSGAHHVYRTGLANKVNGIELIDTGCIVQNGREVFRWVVRNIPNGIKEILYKTEMTIDKVDWFIPHSANLRIIEPICGKMEHPMEKTLYSLVNFGNTSAATIPLSLDLGIRDGKVKNGDRILMYGFGAGLTHAGQLLRLKLDEQVTVPTPL